MRTYIAVAHSVKWTIAAFMGLVSHVPDDLITLAIFVGIDFATGLLAAINDKKLCSEEGLRGFMKKGVILFILGTLHTIEMRMHLFAGITKGAAYYFSVLEVISIMENCSKVRPGIVPPFVMEVLLSARRLVPKGLSVREYQQAVKAGVIVNTPIKSSNPQSEELREIDDNDLSQAGD